MDEVSQKYRLEKEDRVDTDSHRWSLCMSACCYSRCNVNELEQMSSSQLRLCVEIMQRAVFDCSSVGDVGNGRFRD